MTTPALDCHLGEEAPLAEIDALRRAAWTPIVGAAHAAARFGVDDEDRRAWHVTVTHAGALVAAGRLALRATIADLPEPVSFGPWAALMVPPVGFASRLAVAPATQNQGFAAVIIEERLGLARRLGLAQVWGETRTEQVEGLEAYGYRHLGPSADDTVPGEWQIMCAPMQPAGAATLDAA